MRMVGIDIGTNALRMVIAETEFHSGNLKFRTLHEERRITRLGEDIIRSGVLAPQAIDRTIRALKEFREICSTHPAERIVAVATSAVRGARNRPSFLSRVREEIGIEVEVLSGEEEARRTWLGVRHGLKQGERNLLVMDIGGGSTEWMVVTDGHVQETKSMEIGVVKLADLYFQSDPLSDRDQERLLAGIEDAIRPVIPRFRELFQTGPERTFVGVAGTVTTLAVLELGMKDYDPSKVQNTRLSVNQIENWYRKLIGMTLQERRLLPGLEKGREDLILAGTALLMSAMREIGPRDVVVSDYGLREGILLDWIERFGAKHDGEDGLHSGRRMQCI